MDVEVGYEKLYPHIKEISPIMNFTLVQWFRKSLPDANLLVFMNF